MNKKELEIIVLFKTNYICENIVEDFEKWSGFKLDKIMFTEIKRYYKYRIPEPVKDALTEIFKKDSYKNLFIYFGIDI